jgi:hypothetical protein
LVAGGLVGWSLLALWQRRLWPRLTRLQRGPATNRVSTGTLVLLASSLLAYWLLRLTLQAFPSG